MNNDAIITTSMLLSACVTGTCTVLASLATVRAAKRARMRLEKERQASAGPAWGRSPTARLQVWDKVGLLVFLTAFLIVTLVVQVVALSKVNSYPWKERVQSKEWLDWRQRTHKKLSAKDVPEQTLCDVLSSDLPKFENARDLPDRLHRDQAIGDVLLSYPEVSEILKKRLGIYKDSFLGTGFSKPHHGTTVGSISSAKVHEYLIPNLADNDDAVWIWKIKPPPDNKLKGKSIKQIVEGGKQNVEGGPAEDFTPIAPSQDKDGRVRDVQAICERVSQEKRTRDTDAPAVIRFASFPAEKYKNTLGRPEAWRVFASNLSEVWDVPLAEAARFSGYIPAEEVNNTFFMIIYLPNAPHDVVPATWGQIFPNFEKWSKEGPAHTKTGQSSG